MQKLLQRVTQWQSSVESMDHDTVNLKHYDSRETQRYKLLLH